jgi:class 3 adenylate cyclase/tetratricopeptide (TPR) repeat protein
MGVRGGTVDRAIGSQVRKTVTIVFADLEDSTALGERLDPEVLRELQTRYYAAMRGPLERHGGTIEKYIGDAVMAVFGVPRLHEDDALRAVRAAIEMRDAMAALNVELERDLGVGLTLRVGVNSGKVASSGDGFIAGDAVNTAARLQAAAPAGGVIVGSQTRGLVAGAVRMRSHGTLSLKGKARPVPVWQVVGLVEQSADFGTRASTGPLVGRRRELGMLHTRLRRAVRIDHGALVTVTGQAGIGKSRLLKEFVGDLDASVSVLVGRCLPYGEGITYWPLIEIVTALKASLGQDPLESLLDDDQYAPLVASRVDALTGARSAPVTEQGVQWGMRRLFEALARRRPLVLVFDDIQWAEKAMLDLIDHVARTAQAPVLVVCSARGELFERRPDWSRVGGRDSVIQLEPLSDSQSARLVRQLADGRRPVRRGEVMHAAEGNPLFLEHLVAMRTDDPETRAPPTIQALLAARIDALPVDERRVIEAAAIEGRGFHRGAVQALVGENTTAVDSALGSLVARKLIRPDTSEFADDTGYRFTHILVRDAAYDLLAKRTRADHHVAYVDWLLAQDDRGSVPDEIAGYHLERANRYRAELGRPDDHRHVALAERAARHLTRAGRRALEVGDRGGAVNLLERSLALHAAPDTRRAELLIDLGAVLRESGRFRESDALLSEARRVASHLDDAALAARAQVERLLVRLHLQPDAVAVTVRRQGPRLERVLEHAGDHAGLARLWHLRALLAWIRARSGEAEPAWRRAADEAHAAGDVRMASDAVGWEAASMSVGSTPVDIAIARCEEICGILRDDPWAEALAMQSLASLHGMRGEFETAYRLLESAAAALGGFDPTVEAAVSHLAVYVDILAGNLDSAEQQLRAGRRMLEKMGERALLASTEGSLAQVMLLAGREREADRLARRCARISTSDDAWPQAAWRQVRARVLAGRGQSAKALALAREAVEIAMATDCPNLQADTTADLAFVLEQSGRAYDARSAYVRAVGLYEAKGNSVRAAEVRAHLARHEY